MGATKTLWSYARPVSIRWRTVARDAALPAGLAVTGVVELAALQPERWPYGAVMEVGCCCLLVFRRRHTLVLATLASVLLFAIPWVGPQLNDVSAPITIWALAVFSLGRWVRDLRGLAGIAVMAGAVLADYAFVDQRHHNWSDVVFVTALIVPPYVLGRLTRRLSEQKGLLERNQELVKREAVRNERDRIARELHDVVAHSISAMVCRAQPHKTWYAATPTGPSPSWERSARLAGGPCPRRDGCCTSSVTTPTSSGWSRHQVSPISETWSSGSGPTVSRSPRRSASRCRPLPLGST